MGGGAHLSVALALGAALPETKFGDVEVLDVREQVWSSTASAAPSIHELRTETVELDRPYTSGSRDRVAIFVSMTADPDRTAFQRLLNEDADGFSATAVVSLACPERIDPRESARLSAAVAREIRRLAAGSGGRAEVHLAFHGPYAMAVLIGRHLNTLRAVVYEWSNATNDTDGASYIPVLVLEPGVAGGPISQVLLTR